MMWGACCVAFYDYLHCSESNTPPQIKPAMTSPFTYHVASDYIVDRKMAPGMVNQYPSGEAQETMEESVLG